jgi:hypothetical protein
MPVSDSTEWKSIEARTVRSNSHRGAAVRHWIAMPGRIRTSALMTSMSRDAWPKPWPDV